MYYVVQPRPGLFFLCGNFSALEKWQRQARRVWSYRLAVVVVGFLIGIIMRRIADLHT
jgi:hypothetical protein